MRITTSMMNETAKRTGIPINQNSLLNYINQEESSGNSLLDALGKNTGADGAWSRDYKKLEKAAENLGSYAEKLAVSGEDSFYDKMRAGEETPEVYDTVGDLVEAYNDTVRRLQKSSGALNTYYRQMLEQTAQQNKDALEKVGITVNKDGTLAVDTEKLKAASADDLEAVFGAESTFTTRTGFIAGRVSDNARAGMESIAGQYSASGDLVSQVMSKYNFRS